MMVPSKIVSDAALWMADELIMAEISIFLLLSSFTESIANCKRAMGDDAEGRKLCSNWTKFAERVDLVEANSMVQSSSL